jgi:hypothetical protein
LSRRPISLRGGYGGGFSPASIGGLTLWVRSDTGVTVGSGTVSAWADLSGNGNTLTQGTGANQPTYNATDASYNGLPSLSATGTQFIGNAAVTLAEPFTVGVVCVFATNAATSIAIDSTSGTRPIIAAAPPTYELTLGGAGFVTFGTFAQNTTVMLVCVFNGAASVGYASSSTGTTGTTAAGSMLGLSAFGGLGSNLTGSIAEVFLWNKGLAAGDVHSLLLYGASRYNQPSWT